MSVLQGAGTLFLHTLAKNFLIVGMFYLFFVIQGIRVSDPGVGGEQTLALSTIFLLSSLAAELVAIHNEER